MERFLNFVKYNNAFAIGVFMLFSVAGVSFAASPELRGAVYTEEQVVKSVDNTYLMALDLNSLNMGLKITSITDDDTMYYVSYSYNDIDIIDYVWQPVEKTGLMRVTKEQVKNKDLGNYVAEQLGQIVTERLAYFKNIQEEEKKKGLSTKVVTTEYSGLIGKILDPKENEFPGYVPVVDEAALAALADTGVDMSSTTVAVIMPDGFDPFSDPTILPDGSRVLTPAEQEKLKAEEDAKKLAEKTPEAPVVNDDPAPHPENPAPTPENPNITTIPDIVDDAISVFNDKEAPVVTINGDNPVTLFVGDSYTDAGATITDNVDKDLILQVGGSVDTSVVGAYQMTYYTVDRAGNRSLTMIRSVNVYEKKTTSESPATETASTTESSSGTDTATTTTTGADNSNQQSDNDTGTTTPSENP